MAKKKKKCSESQQEALFCLLDANHTAAQAEQLDPDFLQLWDFSVRRKDN